MESSTRKMETISQYVNWARSEGFDLDFYVSDDKLRVQDDDGRKFAVKDAKIVGFMRFEGESDPGDSSIAYMIETNNGDRGTIVDGYGAYADPKVSKFLKTMYQDIRYNPEVHNRLNHHS